MPSDRERGGLVGVKRKLVEAAPVTDPAAERATLPKELTDNTPSSDQSAPSRSEPINFREISTRVEDMTRPATFHLPLKLLQRLRATSRIKNKTMVEFVRLALEQALDEQRPTEAEIRSIIE